MTTDERTLRAALVQAGCSGRPDVAKWLDSEGLEHTAAAFEASTGRTLDADALSRGTDQGFMFMMPGDHGWPDQFRRGLVGKQHADAADEPIGLWARGDTTMLVRSIVAIVGARAATAYGASVATDIARDLNARHHVIVSGAAYGIDQAAHRGSLDNTIAVLANGVDRPYPSAHRELIEHIAANGCVVSEQGVGTPPSRATFLARNRIVAALSRGVVLVEAAHRSGSMNTAKWAEIAGRPLMAVPGPVTSAQSVGCHELIRLGRATLVTSGAEVQETLIR